MIEYLLVGIVIITMIVISIPIIKTLMELWEVLFK